MNIISVDPINSLNQRPQRHLNLTTDGNARIEIDTLPEYLTAYARMHYKSLFSLHPTQRGQVSMFSKNVVSHRWHQSFMNTPKYDARFFGKSYMFSAANKNESVNAPLPFPFEPFLTYMNSLEPKSNPYNQVVINWYADGNDFIARHSDCTIGMQADSPIAVISLCESADDTPRLFQVLPKQSTPNSVYSRVDVTCRHGTIIKMCGNTQETFRHGVPKTRNGVSASRISITLRKYIE